MVLSQVSSVATDNPADALQKALVCSSSDSLNAIDLNQVNLSTLAEDTVFATTLVMSLQRAPINLKCNKQIVTILNGIDPSSLYSVYEGEESVQQFVQRVVRMSVGDALDSAEKFNRLRRAFSSSSRYPDPKELLSVARKFGAVLTSKETETLIAMQKAIRSPLPELISMSETPFVTPQSIGVSQVMSFSVEIDPDDVSADMVSEDRQEKLKELQAQKELKRWKQISMYLSAARETIQFLANEGRTEEALMRASLLVSYAEGGLLNIPNYGKLLSHAYLTATEVQTDESKKAALTKKSLVELLLWYDSDSPELLKSLNELNQMMRHTEVAEALGTITRTLTELLEAPSQEDQQIELGVRELPSLKLLQAPYLKLAEAYEDDRIRGALDSLSDKPFPTCLLDCCASQLRDQLLPKRWQDNHLLKRWAR